MLRSAFLNAHSDCTQTRQGEKKWWQSVNSGVDLEGFCRSPKTNKYYWFSYRRDGWKKEDYLDGGCDKNWWLTGNGNREMIRYNTGGEAGQELILHITSNSVLWIILYLLEEIYRSIILYMRFDSEHKYKVLIF